MEVSGQLYVSGRFTLRESVPGTYWIEGWVGRRAGLDAVAKKKNLHTCRESNPCHPTRSLVTTLLELGNKLTEKITY